MLSQVLHSYTQKSELKAIPTYVVSFQAELGHGVRPCLKLNIEGR